MSKEKLLSNVYGDVLGGIMTTIVALPIAMAFGIASGLGAAAGLYGAMLCGLFASLFGGTRGQQSGPTGPIAVIVASLMVAQDGNKEFVFCAIILAGILQILFGKLRFGAVIQYVPYPVVSGFMTGIALIIIILQVNPFFGVVGSKTILSEITSFVSLPERFNSAAIVIGASTIALMLVFKRISAKLPGGLMALAAVTIASQMLGLNIPTIGNIPTELPQPSLPAIDLALVGPMIVGALGIAILGSIDSLLTSVIADKLTNSRHDSNKELVGQGIGNIAAGLMGGVAGAGSTTRTIANIDSGGRTALSGLVYSLLVLLVITQFGAVASVIPLAGLAAVLILLGFSIIDKRMFTHLLQAPRPDVFVMLIVLGVTVFGDLITAVLIGSAISCILLVKKIADLPVAVSCPLSQVSAALIEQKEFEMSQSALRNIYLYKCQGPLFFGELKKLQDSIESAQACRVIVFDLENALFIDLSCCYFLNDEINNLRKKGVNVLVVYMNSSVYETLSRLNCKAVLESMCEKSSWLHKAVTLAQDRRPTVILRS